ncbi:MAG: hypothetical protein ACI8T1_005171 [Verrucomicrobiales bacterium]
MDTYFRGNSHEVEFCEQAGAGGNHLVAVTANGQQIGEGNEQRGHVRLRKFDLAPLLAAFRMLPEDERQPGFPDSTMAKAPERPVPSPEKGGLVVRGFCTYMKNDKKAMPERTTQFYYKQNPDAWAAETQSDMLWLTEPEWRSLIPNKDQPGMAIEVPEEIQRRFFSTMGIDYMEGSVNALPVRESTMTITLDEDSTSSKMLLRIDGYGVMGKPLDSSSKEDPSTRGCELRMTGRICYDTEAKTVVAFDVAGIGEAWGNKMEYTRREIGLPEPRWNYGIACELVTGNTPYDRIPPYNMLHYGSGMTYFSK